MRSILSRVVKVYFISVIVLENQVGLKSQKKMISKILFRSATAGVALFLLTCFPQRLLAQGKPEQVIKAGIIAGLNFSQIDGDDFARYNKFGINAGGTALIKFHKNWSAGFELLFSQKGSREFGTPNNGYSIRRIKLSYIEVPVMINYHDK